MDVGHRMVGIWISALALAIGGCSSPVVGVNGGSDAATPIDAPASDTAPIDDAPVPRVDAGCDGTDSDSDGHCSVVTGGDDCDDTRADSHPGADEVCTDQDALRSDRAIDEDCDGAIDDDCQWYFGEPHPVASLWGAGLSLTSAWMSDDGRRLYARANSAVAGAYVITSVSRTSTDQPFGPPVDLAGPDTGRVQARGLALSRDETELYTIPLDNGSLERLTSATGTFGGRSTVLAESGVTYGIPWLANEDLELLFARTEGGVPRLYRMTRTAIASPWSAPEPIVLAGAPSPMGEDNPSTSRDGLILFFDVAGLSTPHMAHRARVGTASFAAPVALAGLEGPGRDVDVLRMNEATGEVFFGSHRPWAWETFRVTVWRARLCRDAPCAPVVVDCASTMRSEDGLHCYTDRPTPESWMTAVTACDSMAGDSHLVTINSLAENDFVHAQFAMSGTSRWIGLFRAEPSTVYGWTTAEPLRFGRWATSEPSFTNPGGMVEACVELSVDGTWNDAQCAGSPRASVCERELWPTW